MDREIPCHKTSDNHRYYRFRCPSCGEAGDLGLKEDDQGQFGCPADCGASFIEYKAGANYAIRCVVMPVFADD